jgi:ribonuclease HI
MTAKSTIDIYTDGACKGNPGPGGWGAYLISGAHEKEIFGGEDETTNNRMELTAVIEALRMLKNPSKIRLFIDSQYVKNGINLWISNWKKTGWTTSNKKPVKNVDLWMMLDELVPRHEIEWIWVKGHAGNLGNERADDLANRGVPIRIAD